MRTFVAVFEGVNLSRGLQVREATFILLETGEIKHYFIKPPEELQLNESEKKTDFYIRKCLGGIGVHTPIPGAQPFQKLAEVVTSMGGDKIFCVGDIAQNVLRSILPYGDIENIQQTLNFVYPKTLLDSNCGYKHLNTRYCSLNKLKCVVYYLKFNKVY